MTRRVDPLNHTAHLFLRQLASAGLLGLEVFVQQVQSLLISLSAAHDREHALSGLIVRRFSDGNAGSRASAYLGDFASTPADDATDHVRRNADILSLNFFAVLSDKGIAAVGGIGIRASAIATGLTVAEIGAVTSAVVRTTAVAIAHAAGVHRGGSANRCTNRRIVKDCAGSPLPVVDEAFSNLPNSLLNTLWSALHFHDPFGRLRKHLLLSDHSHTGSILDMFDLQTLSTDNGAHLIVGDQEADS